eukprot:gene8447-9937_t
MPSSIIKKTRIDESKNIENQIDMEEQQLEEEEEEIEEELSIEEIEKNKSDVRKIEKMIQDGKSLGAVATKIQMSRGKVFKYTDSNIFLDRKKKPYFEDDIATCNCTNSSTSPCGEPCLNRKSFYECDKESCFWGEKCQNMRFQQLKYAQIVPFNAAKKGWGLKAVRTIADKDFIIEYCGEVITKEVCLQRMLELESEKYFYFLTLDSKECLDASRKGNIARFINHSCDPNCETQKWNVDGEIRIGIFAIKDIPAGTELTFDYNYERFGTSKQKCYCGASNCRGYLGEKPPSTPKPPPPPKVIKVSFYEDHPRHVEFVSGEAVTQPALWHDANLTQTTEDTLVILRRIFLMRNKRLMDKVYKKSMMLMGAAELLPWTKRTHRFKFNKQPNRYSGALDLTNQLRERMESNIMLIDTSSTPSSSLPSTPPNTLK